VEGEIVSWADRIAYCAHDLEDAVHSGIVAPADLPSTVVEICGATRREQLNTFVRAVVRTVDQHGEVGMPPAEAGALAGLRAFNYERIYVRPTSVAQSRAVIEVLRALVEHYASRPDLLPDDVNLDPGSDVAVRTAVTYVAGMTDRYAFDRAVELLDWDPARLPPSVTSA
jgi:dGTPase